MSDYYSSLTPTRKALYPVPVWAWVTIGLIVVGLIVLGGFVYDISTTTKVPDLLGKSRTEAASLLSDAGLTIGTVSKVETSAPEGTILGQSPAAGASAKRGDAVSLRIAVPIPGIVIPDLRGQDATAAVTAAQNAGLLPVKVSVYSTATVGLVVGIVPAPGVKLPPRGEITLVVSAGTVSKASPVPNLVGLAADAATQTISSGGFGFRVVNGYSDTSATGTVIAQTPAAASSGAPGSFIAILVSKGKATTATAVPDVVGSKQSAAESAVRAQNMTPIVVVVPSTKTAGTVISQFPEATSASGAGGQVLITVAKAGSNLISVPNLIGVSEGQAESTLSALGLISRPVSSVSTGYPLGSISDQIPAPGAKVPAGADIVIGIVKGVPL